MRDLPRQPHFVEEAIAADRAFRRDQLQRDRRVEHQVVGAPDVAHAAAADARHHAIAAREHFTRRKRRRVDVRLGGLGFLVKRQQRLDFSPQVGVVAARLGEERVAVALRAIERLEKQIFRALMERGHELGTSGPAKSGHTTVLAGSY